MLRKVDRILKSKPTLEGAGVHLRRVFGYNEARSMDPFLLLDHFGSENPRDYILGFPWHPHRGIETVTYMIDGKVKHEDSMGNKGVIGSGDVQWMTAGGGIIHQEMPQVFEGRMMGFQLWVNLPSSNKMMSPRYRDIGHGTIPMPAKGAGAAVKVVSGSLGEVKGPVDDIVVDITYLDVALRPKTLFEHTVPKGFTAFAYVFEGSGDFDGGRNGAVGAEHMVVFKDGDEIRVRSAEDGLRFLMISGRPIGEPIAWAGPIVMNTQDELDMAFEEYNNGTFLRHR